MKLSSILTLFIISCFLFEVINSLENYTRSYLNDNEIFDIHHNSRRILSSCYKSNDEEYNSWIIGENAVNGLCNQILGIYSYIPTALLLNVSLIVGEVFSRNSFETDNANQPHGWIKLPFSELFDFNYFSKFWLKYGLDIIDYHDYMNSCLKTEYQHIKIIKEPPFWPVKVSVLLDMFKNSKVTFPIQSNTILKFDKESSKFTALFNYWKGGLKHKLMLLKIHHSLRPSYTIQTIFKEISNEIPTNTIVIHIRLENDYLKYEKLKYKIEFIKAMKHIANHKCIQRYFKSENNISTTSIHMNDKKTTIYPSIYLASGLFMGIPILDNKLPPLNTLHKPSDLQLLRAMQVLKSLQEIGFKNIYTRETLIAKVIEKKKMQQKQYYNISMYELLPEQGAYIDLLVSRNANCFIPAHVSSSFSYMAQRMTQLDHGQVLKYTQITEENFGISEEFKQWGV